MTVEIDVVYQGSLRCEATHAPSRHTLVSDAPTDNQGRGESFSPTDLVATALATCMMTVMGIIAEREDVDLSGTKIKIEKHMIADPERRIRALPAEIRVPIEVPDEKRERLEKAALTCPVMRSVHPDIEKPVRFVWGV